MIPSNTVKTDSTTTSGCLYVGVANSQSASDANPCWTIKRVSIDANSDIVVEFADGEATPKFKWSERATLTYK